MKKLAWLYVAICLSFSFPARNAPAQEVSLSDDTATLLKKKLEAKQAVIWYLGNDAFAVKTKSHLLIFDYYIMGDAPPAPSLANGFINPQELKDLDVVVFVTHRDGDHYDKVIWQWRKAVKRITYVLGWEPAMPQEKYIHFQPHETGRIRDLEVTNVPSTDSGEAFLIKVDGLVIYHGGDFAFWMPSYRPRYLKTVDFLASKTDSVDLLFINWRNAADRATLEEGLWYTADKLGARAIFPMHMFNNDAQIQELIRAAPTAEKRSKIVNKEKRGQRFIYRDGKVIG